MLINSIQVLEGRNIHSHKPVIRMIIDVEKESDIQTCDIPNFNNNLLKLLPGLKKHYCSLGYEGGFFERLKEGTYLPHVTEHIIIELQSLLEYKVNYGKTRVLREPDMYNIFYQFENKRVAVECGRAAVEIVNSILDGQSYNYKELMRRLNKIKIETDLGPSTKAIYDEAVKRNIPVRRIGDDSLLQLGYGRSMRLIQASLTDQPSCISIDLVSNKHLTKQILYENRIPVPMGDIAYTEDNAVYIAESIGFPVAVKPADSNQGKGVALALETVEEVKNAYRNAIKYSKLVIVEKFITGKDYRVLVVGDKVSAVSERLVPFIVGDGIHSVKELVEIENLSFNRGEDHEKPLTKIKLDEIALEVLKKMNLKPNDIPAPGLIVKLRENSNLSTGGTAIDRTDEIHPYNAELAVKCAKLMGLDIAGVDITVEDISIPINIKNGAVIEINAAPGLRMHLHPSEGLPRNVASDIIDYIFPNGQKDLIPIISITGTNGKTTTTRLIAHTISLTGLNVGMTCTSGIYIGNKCIQKGDNTGPLSARTILSDKRVEAAVLETARGGIVRRGLGYDLADVGIITNVTDDHLGLDGINTIEDLAHAKALIIEAVKPDGYAVINADDSMAEYLMTRLRTKAVLFSKYIDNPILTKHLSEGNWGISICKDVIGICSSEGFKPVVKVNSIPITFNGLIDCNIENSLAAVSGLLALGIDTETVARGLKTFNLDLQTNPGRFNMFDMDTFKVMLDYSHNPAGYREVIKFLKKYSAKRTVGVIGMPGDRSDSCIQEVGKLCAGAFDYIYIKEDSDLRGREAGELAGILYEAIIKTGFPKDRVQIVYEEGRALYTALENAEEDDLIIMFYEELEGAVEIVNKYKSEMVSNTQIFAG